MTAAKDNHSGSGTSPVARVPATDPGEPTSELAAIEARLRELEEERARLLEKAARVRASAEPAGTVGERRNEDSDRVAGLSPEAKVDLFRQLFRGRPDVYATRFVSKKTGKAGYAPACAHKFAPGICPLPKIGCGECENQAFRPLDERAVREHLTGRQVVGVYPLLTDDTCWFLAVDFDKKSWEGDIRAFAATARRLGMPVALERSRSCNGGHAWFFFAEPIPATLARALGSFLLTETLADRPEIGLDSYDRLFPSQDTLPKGGLGNLIALPLQWEARQHGGSVFVDEELRAFPGEEQWTLVARMPRIQRAAVDDLVARGRQEGPVIGLAPPADPDADEAPWERLPSAVGVTSKRLTGPVPQQVRGVLAQRLFLEKEGLPPRYVDALLRLAAFQNPEFYKKQAMRLPTTLTPRVICCGEDLGLHLALPRGCVPACQQLLEDHGVPFEVEDQRSDGDPVEVAFRGTLRHHQLAAGEAMLEHDTGVLVAPPGSGKTVIGAWLIAARRRSTLVLVHRQPLLDQWLAQLAIFLEVGPGEIGRIGAGKRAPTGRIDVAMIQSLARKGRVDDLVAGYGQVIVDECHHLPAVSFERVLAEVRARYVVGLTATPQRRDGHQPITAMQLGPVRHRMRAEPASGAPLARRLVIRETAYRPAAIEARPSIQALYGELVACSDRNDQILDDVIQAVEDGRSPIVLTERRDHLELLADRLAGVVRHVVVLHGGRGAKARRRVLSALEEIPPDEERALLAIGRFVGEGFDDPRLDTLFLTLPVSWKGTLVQYAGRLHRAHPDKREVRIFDYVDAAVPVLRRMADRRMRGYRSMGYAVET
jgi:superfamily II DNA or RNA helicase